MPLKCSHVSSFLSSRNEWETLLVETQTEHSRLGGGNFFAGDRALTVAAFLTGALGLTTAPASTRVMLEISDLRAVFTARAPRVLGAAADTGGALARGARAPVDRRAFCILGAGGGVSSRSMGLAREPTRAFAA
jgi:hypothetical protein